MDRQWPLKILLVHPQAPFLMKNSLVFAADCTLLGSSELIKKFKDGETVVIGCPLLEDADRLAEKIDMIIKETKAKEVAVYTMEVPCCLAIHMMIKRGLEKNQRKDIKTSNYIVRVMTGNIEPYTFGRIDRSMLNMEMRAHGMHR